MSSDDRAAPRRTAAARRRGRAAVLEGPDGARADGRRRPGRARLRARAPRRASTSLARGEDAVDLERLEELARRGARRGGGLRRRSVACAATRSCASSTCRSSCSSAARRAPASRRSRPRSPTGSGSRASPRPTSSARRCARSSRTSSCRRSTTRASRCRRTRTGLRRRSRASSSRRGTCSSACAALIDRALQEGWSMVLEGVHLVPGMLPQVEGALVVQCVLAIEDAETHASHFWVRDARSEGLRPVQKYLDALDDIRRIQDFIVEQARGAGVPVVENGSIELSIGTVMELVLSGAERLAPRMTATREAAGRPAAERAQRPVPLRHLPARDRARGARRARAGSAAPTRRARRRRRSRACAAALDELPISGRVVIGAGRGRARARERDRGRRGRRRRRPRARPARGPRRRGARRQRRDLDDRRRRAGQAAPPPGHVHAQDGRRPARAGADRPARSRSATTSARSPRRSAGSSTT